MYHYEEAITNDVIGYVKEHNLTGDRDELWEKLYDDLFAADSVTGNASGSYWCNANKARECIFSDPLAEGYVSALIREFSLDAQTVADNLFNWEYWDVSIRCFLLGVAIDNALDELEIE